MAQGSWTPERLVDTARYPVLDLDGEAARALIQQSRDALQADGLCLLEGFVAAPALAAMAAEARALTPRAHWRDQMNGVWRYDADEEAFPPGHPRRQRHASRHGAIAYDLLPAASPIRALYEWEGLTRLIAAITGSARLHNCGDPLASCVVTVLGDGDAHAWHYDENDFVVSLLLQGAEEGGLFEYAPNIRSAEDENYAEVARIFAGDRTRLKVAALPPGGLALFRGQRSLHHVTPVKGRRHRLIALFSYDRRPGMVFRPEVHQRVFGRNLAAAQG